MISEESIKTILDLYSVDHGLGLKLAQDFPNSQVTLGVNTLEESTEIETITNNCVLYNTNTYTGTYTYTLTSPLTSSPAVRGFPDIYNSRANKYELVLYHTLIDTLLTLKQLERLSHIIRTHTSRYCLLNVL